MTIPPYTLPEPFCTIIERLPGSFHSLILNMAARTDTTKGAFDKVDGGIGISYEEYRKAEPVTGSTALAEALADAKPRPLSKNMIKLYGIMVVGYLIATMNGFGSFSQQRYLRDMVLTTLKTRA